MPGGCNIKVTGFLTQIEGIKCVKEFHLFGSEIQLGRNQKSHIRVLSANVSRRHCAFIYSPEDGWSIADSKSQNGTYVNKEPLQPSIPVKLNNGDLIHLGNPNEMPQAFIFSEVPPDEEHTIVYPKSSSFEELLIKANTNDHHKENELKNTVPSNNSAPKRKNLEKENSNVKLIKKLKSVDTDVKPCCSKDLNWNSHEDKHASSTKDVVHPDFKPTIDGLEKRINDLCVSLNLKTVSSNVAENVNVGNCDVSSSQQQKTSTDDQNVNERSDSKSVHSTIKNGECSKNLNHNISDEAEDNSQSLLAIEGDDFFTSDLSPFSQFLDEEPCRNEENVDHNTISERNESFKQKTADEGPEIAMLREKIASLKAENEALEKSRSELQRVLRENNDLLSKHLSEEKKLKENLEMCEKNVKEDFTSHLVKKLEDELSCNICTELLIKATVLDCSHTFCEFCISQWKKKKKQCPVCRNKIASETKVLVLDHFIDKALDILSPNYKEKRKELLEKREIEKKPPPKRKKAARRRQTNTRNTTSTATTTATTAQNIEEAIGNYVDALSFIEDMQDGFEFDDDSEHFPFDSDIYSDEGSSSPVEGYGFYGGSGRCFNCGRTGHWANGCPGF